MTGPGDTDSGPEVSEPARTPGPDPDPDLLIVLTHGPDAPDYAAHAGRLATAAVALGDRVVLYLAVAAARWLADEAPTGWPESLVDAARAGVSVCVCPTTLAAHGLSLAPQTAQLCGAVAAVELAHRARTVITL